MPQARYQNTIHRLLKPEVFIGELVAAGFDPARLIVVHAGAFKKSFRPETDQVNTDLQNEGDEHLLTITVNRDGLYDRLPEGLFHQSFGSRNTNSVSLMTAEHKRYKDEERLARKFFQPIEQEIFCQASFAEAEEQALGFEMLRGKIKQEWQVFWEIDPGMHPPLKVSLLSMMPWMKTVKGNRDLTAKLLALMLQTPVKAETFYFDTLQSLQPAANLGEAQLGIDTVTGNTYAHESLGWKFLIFELSGDDIEAFTNHEPHKKFLKQFQEIAIPLSIDVSFEFALGEDDYCGFGQLLGYNFAL